MTGDFYGVFSCIGMGRAEYADKYVIDDVGAPLNLPKGRSVYYLSVVQRISLGIKYVFGENTIDDIYGLSS